MTFLCLECGCVNNESVDLICQPCKRPLDVDLHNLLMDYSLRAVRYGYNYRINYEDQVKENGEVKIKYSLLDPTNELQWLAAAALSGIAGNFVYDIIKHIAKQIKNRLVEKSQTIELDQVDQNTFDIVADEQTLSRFVLYIQNYYKGNGKINKKVSDAIKEEEIVHAMTDGKSEQFAAAFADTDDEEDVKKKFLEMFKEGAQEAGKLCSKGPAPKDLEKLFPVIKGKRMERKPMKKSKSKKTKRKKRK